MADLVKTLQNQKGGNKNAFQHVCDVFEDMLDTNSHMASYKQIEILSEFLKKTSFQPEAHKNENPPTPALSPETVLKNSRLLNKETKKEDFYIQNFQTESKIFESANIYFGEDESYKIQQSLIKLAQKEKVTSLRFWGKMLCSKHDYFVAQGSVSTKNRDKAPLGQEDCGQGTNKYTFWVTNNILDNWIELPQVTPDQIKVARRIKIFFTGNLNADVKTYPKFVGKEKHLLKAQLVRITHAAQIVPRGIFKTNEENAKEIEIDEEGKMPEQGELASMENWVHLNPNILQAGRVAHFINPSLNEEERQAALDGLNEGDPELDRLKGVSEDKVAEGLEANYSVKFYGSAQQYQQIGAAEGQIINYQTILIKNQLWPGMFTIAKQGLYSQIYIGYGFKVGTPSFEPLKPSDIMADPQDCTEMAEPNPSKPIKKEVTEQAQEGQEQQGEDQEKAEENEGETEEKQEEDS